MTSQHSAHALFPCKPCPVVRKSLEAGDVTVLSACKLKRRPAGTAGHLFPVQTEGPGDSNLLKTITFWGRVADVAEQRLGLPAAGDLGQPGALGEYGRLGR